MDNDLLAASLFSLHYLAIWTDDVGSVRGGSKNSSKLKWSREAEGGDYQGEDETHDGAEKAAIVEIETGKAVPVFVRFRYFWKQWQGEDMD